MEITFIIYTVHSTLLIIDKYLIKHDQIDKMLTIEVIVQNN